MTADREGFATRWSRKKREEEATADSAEPLDSGAAVDLVDVEVALAVPPTELGEASDQPVVVSGMATPDGSVDADPATGMSHEISNEDVSAEAAPVLTDVDMPPLDTLDGDSDVSGFFSKGVSSALRQAALRQIFSSPRYNVRDGLNDYDGDYTVFEPLGDTITSDMKFHAARKEAARLAALEEEKQLEAQRLAESSSDQSESESDEQGSEANQSASADDEADEADEAVEVDEAEPEVHQPEAADGPDTSTPDDAAKTNETLPT